MPLSGQYDRSLVDSALLQVTMNKYAKNAPADVLQVLKVLFDSNPSRMSRLVESMCEFYSSRGKTSFSLTSANELNDIMRVFWNSIALAVKNETRPELRDYFLKLDSKISKSKHSTDASNLLEMLMDYGSKRKSYMDLYSKGIGNFLPELQTMVSEFDFSKLTTIAPVLNKISLLVSEFNAYLAEQGDLKHFDSNAYRLYINLKRYQSLYNILISRSTDSRLPQEILAIVKDEQAAAIQSEIQKSSGEQEEIDKLIFTTHRNILNAFYVSTGLKNYHTLFAFVNHECRRDVYSKEEKQILQNFTKTFLPLLCKGLLKSNLLNDIKYLCLPVRFDNHVIVPFKFSDNLLDNYELSLAILFEVPCRTHLLNLINPRCIKDYSAHSSNEIASEIRKYFNTSCALLKNDAESLIKSLLAMDQYLIRGFKVLNLLNEDKKLQTIAQEQSENCSTVECLNPSIIDLTSRIEDHPTGKNTNEPIHAINDEVVRFKNEVANFRAVDLNNERFADIGARATLRYLNERMKEVLSLSNACETSAITSENAEKFVKLYEHLTTAYDTDTPFVTQLDHLADEVLHNEKALERSEYVQIPDYLMLHSLHSELEIFKTDELKCDYGELTLEEVLKLLEARVQEVLQHGLTLPESRITLKNILHFKKLLSRLKTLFAVNGGNTEVLDALIKSQNTFDQFESQLRERREAKAPFQSSSQKVPETFSGPYLQIPDELQLHQYIEELSLLRKHDLSSEYKDMSAQTILELLQERTDNVYKGLPVSYPDLCINADNFVRFINLQSKLKKLFILNGGNTAILDTLIHSQSVFEKFESKIAHQEKSLVANDENVSGKAYIQVPDQMVFEEYSEELLSLRHKLGCTFASTTAEDILLCLEQMQAEEMDLDQKVVLGKLLYNLHNLFKLNNNHTFVLDNILLSAKTFDQIEQKISNKAAAENTFVMGDFLKDDAKSRVQADDYVLSLLPDKEKLLKSVKFDSEDAIQTAVHKAFSSYSEENENGIVDENNNFVLSHVESAPQRVASKAKEIDEHGKPIHKETLQKFLEKAKHKNESKLERQWRERKAYEWSSNMANGNRSLESRNFFDPFFEKTSRFPMFPSINGKGNDYLVLTGKGDTFMSNTNPLGETHTPEDMVGILERLSEKELEKFSKSINKLQKRNWRLIGASDGKDKLLVLSRKTSSRPRIYLAHLKSLVGSALLVFLLLIGLNYCLEERTAAEEKQLVNKPTDALADNSRVRVNTATNPNTEKTDLVVELNYLVPSENTPRRNRWALLLWKI